MILPPWTTFLFFRRWMCTNEDPHSSRLAIGAFFRPTTAGCGRLGRGLAACFHRIGGVKDRYTQGSRMGLFGGPAVRSPLLQLDRAQYHRQNIDGNHGLPFKKAYLPRKGPNADASGVCSGPFPSTVNLDIAEMGRFGPTGGRRLGNCLEVPWDDHPGRFCGLFFCGAVPQEAV